MEFRWPAVTTPLHGTGDPKEEQMDSDNNKLSENYRSHAASMRAMAASTSHERVRAECLELAVGWDLLAKRLEDLTTKLGTVAV